MEGPTSESTVVAIRIRGHVFRGAVRHYRSTEIGFDFGVRFAQTGAWKTEEFDPAHLQDGVARGAREPEINFGVGSSFGE